MQVKPDELLRVYNILAQNAEQLTEYYDDQAGESVKLLEAKGFYFKAHRCAPLAGAYRPRRPIGLSWRCFRKVLC